MSDNLWHVWKKFKHERTASLWEKYEGRYRAIVAETNDPLDTGRIRIFVPELHDESLLKTPEALPWAVGGTWHGGKGCGSWNNPIIGDVVFVVFEKGHAYAPIVVGFGDPTRRGFYSLRSIHTRTPIPIDVAGKSTGVPRDDFLEEYLPKDSRPMSVGQQDRYGSFFMLNSVGFYPTEHKEQPASAGFDAVAKKDFDASKKEPEVNDPDLKYAMLHTKYGHTFICNDIGYKWDKEFKGNFDDDLKFEIDRSKYLTKLLSEEKSKDKDQRRVEIRTRYGHKFELRDVGWNKTRPGEYTDQFEIADKKDDERWVKIRSKYGHLIQMIDTGADPEQDLFIKKLLKSEVGGATELENEMGTDRRMIRMMTQNGMRLALDDRGADPKDAFNKQDPIGNGFLVKGVKGKRGFGIEFNEKTAHNRMMIYTPKSKGAIFCDRFDYIMIHTDTSGESISELVEPSDRYRDNAFALSTGLTRDAESNTFHFKLDKANRYGRFKSPQQQGVEFRDDGGPCGTWSESRDAEGRGVFMSKTDQMLVIRDKGVGIEVASQITARRPDVGSVDPIGNPNVFAPGTVPSPVDDIEGNAGGFLHQKFIILDDDNKAIIIKNLHVGGKIQIVCPNGDIEFVANNITFNAKKHIGLKAGVEICQEARGSQFVVRGGHVGTNTELRARRINCVSMFGTHEAIQIPLHPAGPAPPGEATGCSADTITEIKRTRIGPREFDKEQGCAPNKLLAGPVAIEVRQGGGDSPPPPGGPGGPDGNGDPGGPPEPGVPGGTVNPEPPPLPFIPTPTPEPNNFENLTQGGGSVLWYGVSSEFLAEIQSSGILLASFANNDNVPPAAGANKITLAFSLPIARGEAGQILRRAENFAPLSKKRYGGTSLILRIFQVPEPEKLSKVENNPDIYEYFGSITPEFFDVYDLGTDEFEGTPQFPDIA